MLRHREKCTYLIACQCDMGMNDERATNAVGGIRNNCYLITDNYTVNKQIKIKNYLKALRLMS